MARWRGGESSLRPVDPTGELGRTELDQAAAVDRAVLNLGLVERQPFGEATLPILGLADGGCV
ncbi:MAG: hypothetical protein ACR2OB_01285 [Solirubrobacteraceae bacterium]